MHRCNSKTFSVVLSLLSPPQTRFFFFSHIADKGYVFLWRGQDNNAFVKVWNTQHPGRKKPDPTKSTLSSSSDITRSRVNKSTLSGNSNLKNLELTNRHPRAVQISQNPEVTNRHSRATRISKKSCVNNSTSSSSSKVSVFRSGPYSEVSVFRSVRI